MIDITHKPTTHRIATAEATVQVGSDETMKRIQQGTVPKGDVFTMAKTAALFGVKRTPDAIPECHPIPVESTEVSFETYDNQITIVVEAQTIYRTGIEVEAMHGASNGALTMYDMLKPIDDKIDIQNVKLRDKKGGKTDYADKFQQDFTAAVIVCSDSIANGDKTDKAGLAIQDKLEANNIQVADYTIIPDEEEIIQKKVNAYCDQGMDMVLITGGTGLSPRDVTPEAVRPLLDVEIPGIMEAARSYGQERTPFAMLSRGIAGLKGETLIAAMPGSTRGASETMDALFPYILHLYRIIKGRRH